jgi:hypothetical protein
VDSRVKGLSRLAAAGAIVILASGVAACSSSGGSNNGTGQQSQAQTPQQAIQLAANTSRTVNSFSATVSVKVNTSGTSGSPGALSLTGTVSERLHPSLLAQADYSAFDVAGQSFPGGMSEIITPSSVYIKLSLLTQALHTSKPWIAIPFSALSKATGVNLGSLFSQLQTSSPLNQSQLFAGATNVKKVGTSVIDGVPVTEYSGSVSMTAALAKLPASVRSSLGADIQKAGINSAKFTEWVDAQHQVRKVVVTESGSLFSETITTTVNSINQPVNVQTPPASQTTSLPASVLNSSGV